MSQEVRLLIAEPAQHCRASHRYSEDEHEVWKPTKTVRKGLRCRCTKLKGRRQDARWQGSPLRTPGLGLRVTALSFSSCRCKARWLQDCLGPVGKVLLMRKNNGEVDDQHLDVEVSEECLHRSKPSTSGNSRQPTRQRIAEGLDRWRLLDCGCWSTDHSALARRSSVH